MKQRIKLAQALVHDPDLLFLDEPTNGMDPKGRDEMLALVRDLATRKGVNLILSSHLLPDVEATCAQVIVMYRGAVAAQGAIADLKTGRREVFELRVKGDVGAFIRGLQADGVECRGSGEEVMRVFVKAGPGAARPLRGGGAAPGAGAPSAAERAHPRGRLRRGGRGRVMPIHDQSYRRYAGPRNEPGSAWLVIAAAGIRTLLGRKLFLAVMLAAWGGSSSCAR